MSNGYVYLCMADEDFPRRIAFAFLEDIRQRFENQYKLKADTAAAYAFNAEFGKVCV